MVLQKNHQLLLLLNIKNETLTTHILTTKSKKGIHITMVQSSPMH